MQETPETLLKETSDLLDELIPILRRNIKALQHDPDPLLQHLIQKEVEHQKDLLRQIDEVKQRLHDCLNSPEDDEAEDDSQLSEITGGPSPVGVLPAGAVRRGNYPLAVTIPDRNLEIRLPKGIDTLIKVIEELGIERVRALGIMSHGIPLVAINEYEPKQKQVRRYYIAANTSTDTKVAQIMEIARGLKIKLIPEQLNLM